MGQPTRPLGAAGSPTRPLSPSGAAATTVRSATLSAVSEPEVDETGATTFVKILAGLGFKQNDFHKPAREYSGGWVMRAHLAQLLVMEPDLLMLDEPTNPLDLLSLLWLQRYLLNSSGAVLMISHDRDFMDAIIETVIEIDPDAAKLISYTGNYSSYLEQREKTYEQRVQAYRNQNKEIEGHQEFIDRFRQVGSKAAQVQSRIKFLEKLEKIEKPRAPRKPFKFSFPQPPRSNQKVMELTKVGQAYGDKRIYKDLDLTIERGDRMVLVGPNGAGKSTLLKILAGVLPIDGGKRDARSLAARERRGGHALLPIGHSAAGEVCAEALFVRERAVSGECVEEELEGRERQVDLVRVVLIYQADARAAVTRHFARRR